MMLRHVKRVAFSVMVFAAWPIAAVPAAAQDKVPASAETAPATAEPAPASPAPVERWFVYVPPPGAASNAPPSISQWVRIDYTGSPYNSSILCEEVELNLKGHADSLMAVYGSDISDRLDHYICYNPDTGGRACPWTWCNWGATAPASAETVPASPAPVPGTQEPVPHVIVQNYAGSTATITIDGQVRCTLADQAGCNVIVSRGHHHIVASLGSQYAEDDEELPADMNGGYAWIAECDFTTHGLNCRYPDKGFSKY